MSSPPVTVNQGEEDPHCSCFQGAINCEAATQIKATKMIKRRPGTSLVDV